MTKKKVIHVSKIILGIHIFKSFRARRWLLPVTSVFPNNYNLAGDKLPKCGSKSDKIKIQTFDLEELKGEKGCDTLKSCGNLVWLT